MTDDKCICGEINARHCPVHQEPEIHGGFISIDREAALVANAATIRKMTLPTMKPEAPPREWLISRADLGCDDVICDVDRAYNFPDRTFTRVVEAERLEQAERERDELQLEVWRLRLVKDADLVDSMNAVSLAHGKKILASVRASRDSINEELTEVKQIREKLIAECGDYAEKLARAKEALELIVSMGCHQCADVARETMKDIDK